jgi:hypothetical protein
MRRHESRVRGSEMNGGAAPLVMELCNGAQLKPDAMGLLDGLNQAGQGHGLLRTCMETPEREGCKWASGWKWLGENRGVTLLRK